MVQLLKKSKVNSPISKNNVKSFKIHLKYKKNNQDSQIKIWMIAVVSKILKSNERIRSTMT